MDAESLGKGRLAAFLRGVCVHRGRELTGRVRIRSTKPRDLPAIVRIEKRCFDRDAWSRRVFEEYLAEPRAVFITALIGNRTAGYALALRRRAAAGLDSIAVTPAARGRNIARRLLRRTVRALVEFGVESVVLMVRLDNSAAIALYRKFGFRRVRRINDYYEDGAPAWQMRLLL